jgi:hypothetical protein
MRTASPMHESHAAAATSHQPDASSVALDDSVSVNGGMVATSRGGLAAPVPKADPHELQHMRGVVLMNAAKLRAATWQVR